MYDASSAPCRSACRSLTSQILRVLFAPFRMGTKHTTRGPNARRRSVFAARAFPQGSSPIFRDASGLSDSGSCLDEATPEARVSPEIPPVSNGAGSSESPTEGSDGVDARGGVERPLPKPADDPAVSKVKNLDGESTTEAESESNSRNLNTHEATVKPAAIIGETGERNVASGSVSGETADAERKQRSLLEQQSRSGKKAGDNQKRELSEDPDQDARNIKKHNHGDGSSQAPGKMVILFGLMAAPNCPWRNGRKARISKP